MELLNKEEIISITNQYGFSNVLKWTFEEFKDKTAGYLAEHLNLVIEVECNGSNATLNFFVKCMPRTDLWRAEYLIETSFFKNEYVMLSRLFNEFEKKDLHRWRPKTLLTKDNIFVLENVVNQGYKMPNNQETLKYEEITASITTLARFHAQSFIYEERKSKELRRPYRIWDNYSDYLREPCKGQGWRDTGTKAVIDFLKVFSKHKSKPNFSKNLELIIPDLYDKALDLMKPSSECRNAVVHTDLYTNNIFLKKKDDKDYHALFIDFQTVVYCSPMLDLSSLIYFNTSRTSRTNWTDRLIELYYTVLSEELNAAGVNINDVLNKDTMMESYEKSIVFGITQAALVIPMSVMNKEQQETIFCNPETAEKVNVVSRSEEFINIAKEDDTYRTRLIDLFDEIVERYVYSQN